MEKKTPDTSVAYVYGIRPKQGSYFYIGSTIKPIQHRFKQHIQQVKSRGHVNRYFIQAVNEHGIENVEIDELEVTTAGERFNREYAWVAKLEAAGVTLMNIVKSERQQAHIIGSSLNRDINRRFRFEKSVESYLEQYDRSYWLNEMSPAMRRSLMAVAPKLIRLPPPQKALAFCRERIHDFFVETPRATQIVYGTELYEELLSRVLKMSYYRDFGIPTALMVRPSNIALQITH